MGRPLGRKAASRRVAVCVDKSTAYGRGVLRGIADFVDHYGPWSLHLEPHSTGVYASDWLRHWRGDGVIAYVESPRLAGRLRRVRVPVVDVLGNRLDLGLPQVASDEEAFGRMAADHLLERRFLHFAFSGYLDAPWSDRRREGFEERLAERRFRSSALLTPHESPTLAGWERTQLGIQEWLRDLPRPVGLLACTDRQALRILDACRRAHLLVPEEIAVIGVDNDEESCRLANPPLTSVIDDARRIGFEAARLLHRLMGRPKRRRAPPPVLVPPRGVASRRSTDVTAIDDPVVARAAHLIRLHACEGLTVPRLLAELGVARTAFYARFRRILGRSPHHELLRVRLERVKGLLLQTTLPLEQIAEHTGFQHPEYLQVAFKRETGQTPGAFRASGGLASAGRRPAGVDRIS